MTFGRVQAQGSIEPSQALSAWQIAASLGLARLRCATVDSDHAAILQSSAKSAPGPPVQRCLHGLGRAALRRGAPSLRLSSGSASSLRPFATRSILSTRRRRTTDRDEEGSPARRRPAHLRQATRQGGASGRCGEHGRGRWDRLCVGLSARVAGLGQGPQDHLAFHSPQAPAHTRAGPRLHGEGRTRRRDTGRGSRGAGARRRPSARRSRRAGIRSRGAGPSGSRSRSTERQPARGAMRRGSLRSCVWPVALSRTRRTSS